MPKAIIPSSIPRLSLTELNERLSPIQLDRTLHLVILLRIHGYYLKAIGDSASKERGIYVGALFMDSPK